MDRESLSADVLEAASGNAAAFERLVAANQTLVCSIALAISGDLDASEEIAQDTFVAAWKGLRKLRSSESFLPWIRQMTRNRAHEYIRSRIRDRRLANASLESAAETATSSLPHARQQLLEKEQLHALHSAISALPEESREILILYYRENKSVRQVASLLELTPDAVKKRLSRGRDRLRADVEQQLDQTLRSTLPAAAFTGSVMAALSFAAPVSATAAGMGFSAKASAPLAISAGVAAGVFAGIVGGVTAISEGLRQNLKKAAGKQERSGLWKNAAFQILVVILFELVCVGTWQAYHWPALVLAIVTIYWLLLNLSFFTQLKITSRRRHLEMNDQPTLIAKNRKRRILGMTISIIAYIAVMAGLIVAFRLKGQL